jgi:peroxiredoxin
LRDAEPEITAKGASIVAVGTGDARYAAAFVRDEEIPYLVLVDDDAAAARAAQVRVTSFLSMFKAGTWKATVATWKRGYHIHRSGKRVTQMGGTWVIGPGNVVHYEHVDGDSTDHASITDVVAALEPTRA